MDNFGFSGQSAMAAGHEARYHGYESARTPHEHIPNCFTISAEGRVTEGIWMEFNHPAAGGKTALILGEAEGYIMRDIMGGLGCSYYSHNGRAHVMNASIFTKEAIGGGSFPLLRKEDQDSERRLAHISYGMPEGSRMKAGFEPLYSGISGSAKRIVRGGSEVLVEFSPSDDLIIFAPSGRVIRVDYDDLSDLKVQVLENADALDMRLERVEVSIRKALDMEDEGRSVRQYDRSLHELASLLRMSGFFPEFREKIIHEVERIAGGDTFRPNVAQHFMEVLALIGDNTIYGWLASVAGYSVGKAAQPSSGMTLPPKQYDGRLHGLISDAKSDDTEWRWTLVATELTKASEEGQLRPGVHKRFLLECPVGPGFLKIRAEVNDLKLAVVVDHREVAKSPLGSKTKLSRREADARRAANRAERLARQPSKGKSGQKPNPHGGDGKKGGEKK